MTKIEEILEAVTQEMEDNNINNTIENRLSMLEGVRNSWREDPDTSLEKALYMIALQTEIGKLRAIVNLRQTV
jgi:hypothetical protein